MDNDTTPVEIEDEQTVPVPALTNAELVYGAHLFEDHEIPCAPFGIGGAW